MRNLSANALAKIATTHGNEPITIVEIDWVEGATGGAKLYADRNITGIPGRILEVGDLDNVIDITDNDNSQELSMTLDDTDGTIKAILDTNDIHKRDARVYQWFEGMDIVDRFLLFAGKISSPITWNQREQTVAFTIISQLEDKEVGFSAEEGQFPWIPKDLIGKAWPMIFGKVQDVPAMQFNQAVKGSTLCGVGIISGKNFSEAFHLGGNDAAYYAQMFGISMQLTHLWKVYDAWNHLRTPEAYSKASQTLDQINEIRNQQWVTNYNHVRNIACSESKQNQILNNPLDEGCNPVQVLGGEDFPQNTGMMIRIGQGLFTGHFVDDLFYISDRLHEENETKAKDISSGLPQANDPCVTSPPLPKLVWYEYDTVAANVRIHTKGSSLIVPPSDSSRPQQIAQHYWAEAGTTVEIASSEPITYVVSIVPGTVLAVKAYKTFDNERKLINVPDDLYVIQVTDYGPIQAVEIVIDKPLSTITGQGWSDDLYVTFESDIGPHTCDILEYIIDNYTDLEYDTTSFTNIRTALTPFPMNFPLLEKKNALTVLQEIAFQARCALWISNGTFYIKYLPEEPTPDDTITVSDIDAEAGLEVELTTTEDLITRMNVKWRISWNEDKPNKVILRHNVKKYGTQQEDFFFYCFNQPDIVLKAATFWLIRKSNTWKKVKFSTYLQKLNLEVFDTVTLSLGDDYVSSSDIKAIVEEASYNSDNQTINFTCLTPVKSGTMVEYQFFWPAAEAVTAKFPTDFERVNGYAGGDGIGTGAEGDLPIGFTDPDDWGSGVVWVGGPNVVFRGPADWGEQTPTDIDFVAQPVIFTNQYAELEVTANPDPLLEQIYKPDDLLEDLRVFESGTLIDIRETSIIDSDQGENGPVATLSTFFRTITDEGDNGKLIVDCDESLWTNDESGEDQGKEFHFRYDDENGKFGAGTAWLQD